MLHTRQPPGRVKPQMVAGGAPVAVMSHGARGFNKVTGVQNAVRLHPVFENGHLPEF